MQLSRNYVVAASILLVSAAIAPAQDSAAALAAKIDQHIASHWPQAKVTPAPPADDAEFLRRVHLDLVGHIPTVAEAAHSWRTNSRTAGNASSNGCSRVRATRSHFAAIYRALLIPEAGNNFLVRFQQGSFEDWLKQKLARNTGFDKITRELLTAPVGEGGPQAFLNFNNGPTPIAYYSAKDFKAESLAAGTARVFLGVRVECASATIILLPTGRRSNSGAWPFSSPAFKPSAAATSSSRPARLTTRGK